MGIEENTACAVESLTSVDRSVCVPLHVVPAPWPGLLPMFGGAACERSDLRHAVCARHPTWDALARRAVSWTRHGVAWCRVR